MTQDDQIPTEQRHANGSSEVNPFAVPDCIAAGMLLIAIAPLAYGYYQLLRLVVCGVSIYGAFLASQRGKSAWV